MQVSSDAARSVRGDSSWVLLPSTTPISFPWAINVGFRLVSVVRELLITMAGGYVVRQALGADLGS